MSKKNEWKEASCNLPVTSVHHGEKLPLETLVFGQLVLLDISMQLVNTPKSPPKSSDSTHPPSHRPESQRLPPQWCRHPSHNPQGTCSPPPHGSERAPGSSWSRCPGWPPWSSPWTWRRGDMSGATYMFESGFIWWAQRITHVFPQTIAKSGIFGFF